VGVPALAPSPGQTRAAAPAGLFDATAPLALSLTTDLKAVPYAFDWSGVIAAVFVRFQEKKDAIYALYRDEPALTPKARDQALRYYDEFYKTIEDPRAIKREFLQKCGNQP